MISNCEIEPLPKIVLLYVGSHVTHEAKHFSYFYLGRQQNQVLHCMLMDRDASKTLIICFSATSASLKPAG